MLTILNNMISFLHPLLSRERFLFIETTSFFLFCVNFEHCISIKEPKNAHSLLVFRLRKTLRFISGFFIHQKTDVMERLEGIAYKAVKQTGLFHNRPALYLHQQVVYSEPVYSKNYSNISSEKECCIMRAYET